MFFGHFERFSDFFARESRNPKTNPWELGNQTKKRKPNKNVNTKQIKKIKHMGAGHLYRGQKTSLG